MLTVVWIALVAGGVCVAGATALVVVRGLRTWRALRALLSNISSRLGDLEAQGAVTEQAAAQATASATRLAAAVARLQQSLATLAVLRAAAAEARSGVARIGGMVPRK